MLAVAVLCLNLVSAHAQFGPAPSGPDFGGPMGKLFGNNQAFSANLELQASDSSSNLTVMPGKICFDSGKSRFEINMTEVQSKQIPPGASAQLKSMGLDQMVMVARPDKKVAYLVYPGMQSYVETGLSEAAFATTNGDYKVETTELGKETVDSHPCVKNKVVVTGKDGDKQEFTAWNATDLKNFPVKIQTTEAGASTVMLFKNVSLTKPATSLFETPAGYTKYDDMQTMMQQQILKRMGGGLPGGTAAPPDK
ncbi:MAG TPA: hypothetical protein VN836_12965 [Verrucomicrobiae bacterium]|nr:hypothetical protein [Verrucomicrobiae bacterium]